MITDIKEHPNFTYKDNLVTHIAVIEFNHYVSGTKEYPICSRCGKDEKVGKGCPPCYEIRLRRVTKLHRMSEKQLEHLYGRLK